MLCNGKSFRPALAGKDAQNNKKDYYGLLKIYTMYDLKILKSQYSLLLCTSV